METLKFNYKGTCGIDSNELFKESVRLNRIFTVINEATKTAYATDFASVNVPMDRNYIENSEKLANKFKDVSLLVLVGIGGSNLGTMALQEALKLMPKIKILYADTVDTDYLANIIALMENELKAKKNVVINCVTKSGATTESVANFLVLLNILKKYRKNYRDYVVVTTDKHSKLYFVAKKEEFHILELPAKLGGRYSVFSYVGLFPLVMLGINIRKLVEGAKSMRKYCLIKDVMKNPAALSALIMFLQYRRGKNIINTFLFSNELVGVGKWYNQLMAESLGKERDFLSRLVNAGFTPIYSIGSTDLHSMAQLYFGGPNDKVTTFVSFKKIKNKLIVPKNNEYTHLAKVQGKSLGFIMNAILEGTKRAYANKHLPYMSVELPERSEYSLGQFLQLKMFEIIYLGYLMNVNPFDQPNVEEYKEEVRRLLK